MYYYTATGEVKVTKDGSICNYNEHNNLNKTNCGCHCSKKVVEGMTEVKNEIIKEKYLAINGNLKLNGKLDAKQYETIKLAESDKICIGDTCLDKTGLDNLLRLIKKE